VHIGPMYIGAGTDVQSGLGEFLRSLLFVELFELSRTFCLALKLSAKFDEDAVLLLVTTNMASETKVGSTHSIADVTAWTTWGRCRVRMSARATAWLNSDVEESQHFIISSLNFTTVANFVLNNHELV